MAKRDFKLQSVLDVKELREEKLQQELALLQDMCQELQQDLFELLIDEGERMYELKTGMGESNLDVNTIHVRLEYLEQVGVEIQRQNAYVNDVLGLVDKKRKELMAVAQEKKALEKLKDKNEQKWFLEDKRAEGKFVDELSMARFNRREFV